MTRTQTLTISSLALAAALTCATNGFAATLHVTTRNDSGDGSLRAAVESANATPEPDTITFDISRADIYLATPLVVSTQITIDGAGRTITLVIGQGHGISIEAGGALHLNSIIFWDSDSNLEGDGIENAGTLLISDCTFNGNPHYVGTYIGNTGTLMVNGSTFSWPGTEAIKSSGTVTIGNSTFAGGARGLVNSGTATVVNSTFATQAEAAILNTDAGTVNLANAILANSGTDRSCENTGGSGAIAAIGANLVQGGSCSIPNALSGDPLLGPLADNGGRTQTFALLPGSPAISAANMTVCAGLPINGVDQRGLPRGIGGTCDLGAYETQLEPFAFTGFFAPVDNLPVLNTAKAGAAIPVKFSLDGYQGLDILASGYPRVAQVPCSSGDPQAPVEQTVGAGASGLSYDPATDTYSYVWKTQKSWSGTCQQLLLQLTDGQMHVAKFGFR